MESETLKINIIGGIQVLYDEYQRQLDTKPEKSFTSLELYIECREYQDKTNLAPHIFFSDLLLLLLQNNRDLKKIKVEGYERYCYTKQYMRHDPSEFGLFSKFTDLVEEYKETGQTQPYFVNLEEISFIDCNLNESDLRVLGSSLFPNLKKVYCFYCTPTDLNLRDKYMDFIPNIEWDDKYDDNEPPNVKNSNFYSDKEDHIDYSNGMRPGHYLDSR